MATPLLSTHRWQKLRAHVLSQTTICYLCGRHIDPGCRWPDPLSATVDHRVPLDAGGSPFDPANLAPVHKECNERKGRGDAPPSRTAPTTRQW